MLLHTAPKMPIPRHPSSRQKGSHCVRRVTGGCKQVQARKRKQGIPAASAILHSSFFILHLHSPDSIAMFRT